MFYLFHGNDEHSQKETLAEVTAKLGDPSMLELNTTRFEGTKVSFSELQHACDSIPFLADKRLVIVSNLWNHKPAFQDELLTYLPTMPETTRLFFLESKKLPARHRLLKLIEENKRGHVRAFERPEGRQLERWIQQRVRDTGGQIQPRAANALAVNVGNNLELLANEIEKLVLYRGSEAISEEDVILLCPYVAEASIFDLVDALGSRNSAAAGQLLHQKLADGTDPFYLFAMIVRQFRLLIQVKELADQGSAPPDTAKAIKIHPYVAGKLHQQSHHYTLPQLEAIYRRLLDIDVGVKTGQSDMTTSLSLLVAGVTA